MDCPRVLFSKSKPAIKIPKVDPFRKSFIALSLYVFFYIAPYGFYKPGIFDFRMSQFECFFHIFPQKQYFKYLLNKTDSQEPGGTARRFVYKRSPAPHMRTVELQCAELH
jgi:hypothetical protein